MDGALVVDLCERGDQMILEETKKVYKEKEMKKGRRNEGGGRLSTIRQRGTKSFFCTKLTPIYLHEVYEQYMNIEQPLLLKVGLGVTQVTHAACVVFLPIFDLIRYVAVIRR